MPDDAEVRREVLAYLRSHPQAADTLRGIVSWWLPRQRLETGHQRIGQVLDALVSEGLLRRDPLPDGEALYGLERRAGTSRQR
ncbi:MULTISPECIES: hypothetical protein [Rhodanobacter]|uniref:Uncharacterized protein n=2 Tax=Rhodanobacter TaxID=75309 RepID=I4VYX6_9GAMM|nr:hypothetical protein [Rhodanobacter spathiphylli]EIL92417.1 hypothetical protein UU7_11085 [Rhodanobacter spathiphylli B39]